MKRSINDLELSVPETEMVVDVKSLKDHLKEIEDPRDPRGVRYELVDLLVLLILAKMGGEDTLKGMADWVQLRRKDLVELLGLPHESLPHPTTYARVMARLDIDQVEAEMSQFFARQTAADHTITLDGKTLRGTIGPGQTQGVHLLAAYGPQQGVVLMQTEVDHRDNEIVVAPHVLDQLDLKQRVVTGDAMFTQRDLCKHIVEADGDYVLPVKANQPQLQQAIADVFMPAFTMPGHPPTLLADSYAQTVDKAHGRLEHRFLSVSSHLNAYLDWPHLAQVFRLQRVVLYGVSGRLTYQVLFGITSLPADRCSPQRLLHLLRQHWHIENRLHYVRDVSLSEDACQIRHPLCQRFLACLNNLIIGLIRQTAFDFVPDARRYFALHFADAYQLLL